MEEVKVIVENWPTDPWLKVWIPILIAGIAVVLSVVSIYYMRREFIRNSRPYVCAFSFIERRDYSHVPQAIIFKVLNAPTRILKQEIKIVEGRNIILKWNLNGERIQYPVGSSQWDWSTGEKEWSNIMDIDIDKKKQLERHIYIEYKPLDRGKKYFYDLEQEFVPEDNQWRDKRVNSN